MHWHHISDAGGGGGGGSGCINTTHHLELFSSFSLSLSLSVSLYVDQSNKVALYVWWSKKRRVSDRQMQMLFPICNAMELKQMFQSSKRCFLPRRNSTRSHRHVREWEISMHPVHCNKVNERDEANIYTHAQKKISEIIFCISWSFVCISMSHTTHHRHTFNI